MIDILRERYGEQFEIVRTEAVSAKVGGELQSRALLAILLSFAATLIYLAFRFEWRFGLAAVIATAHDILLTLGLLALLRLDVALPTVAAVLTIVGYSLNDTIIVFDRVRENLGGTLKRENFVTILNRSINETLPRTVLTSGTTLVTLFALFIFGGGTLRSFAMILIFGIGVGTFSSIFVASPALYEIEKRWPGERVKARVRPRTA
jgi:preprotein translocase subunit SecF